jgi:hypothetical protein
MLVLGAGSHPFDVTALMRESLGVDTTTEGTREDVVLLLREVLAHGLFRNAPRA